MSGVQASFRIEMGGFDLDVALSAPGKGITALFGPSGSGKTSVLRCLAGLERPQQGFLVVNGETWQDSRHGIWLPPHRRAIGYVFQDARLFPHLSVRGNLEYGLRRIPAASRRVSFDDAVALLGLDDLLQRRPEHLSGGERQRTAISRALLTSPSLLLMDEPLSALDEASKQDILPYLERLHRELSIPVFYVSHAIKEVARLADYLVLIGKGRVVAQGALHELLTLPELQGLGDDDRGSVIEAVVAGHDVDNHLTSLDFQGGSLWVGQQSLPIGHKVRVYIPASDVSLTLVRHQYTSILNILEARIEQMVPLGAAQMLLRLSLGDSTTALLVRITRKSTAHLALQPGLKVYAQIKSVSLMRAGQ